MIFPTDTLQQKIQITDVKLLLASENTCSNHFGHHCIYIFNFILFKVVKKMFVFFVIVFISVIF